MRQFAEKKCLNCKCGYIPTGSCSKFCSIKCRDEFNFEHDKELQYKHYAAKMLREGRRLGGGSGCTTGRGRANHMYKNGFGHFKNIICKQIKEQRRYCETCGKDLKDATHYQWVIHHIDHNQLNNPKDGSNWMLLCKRCHQIEHKCWIAWERATTRLIRLPNGRFARDDRSPQESGEAPDTPTQEICSG